MFLNGTAMSGQKDHHAIAGATFVGPARTAPRHRFFAVRDEFPGLLPVDEGGLSIDGELYEVDEVLDIADLGGWRAYQAHLAANAAAATLLGLG
jgi:gamma-glutamylcyclotransferase (GGCT)/AIG2-like uncharacterized protein YtfP